MTMNSCFHSQAVLFPDAYLKPQGYVNNTGNNQPFVQGRSLNKLSTNQVKYCPSERIRYDKPFKEKRKTPKKKTIFPKAKAHP